MSFAQTPNGRIYVESHGQGPALVVVPAFGATTRTSRGLLPNLTPSHRVLLYDILGMGQSDDLPAVPTMDAFADEVLAVLDHVGVERASLLASSMGAIIAQHFAVRHRDRLDRLVLITPPVRRSWHTDHINDMLIDLMAACGPVKLVQYMLHLALSPRFVDTHPAFVDALIRGVELTPRDGETLIRLLNGATRFDGVKGLSAIDAPTLILAGELDLLTPPSQAEMLHAELPNSELVVMKGVAHTPFIERTQETFELIRVFLAGRLDGAEASGATVGEDLT